MVIRRVQTTSSTGTSDSFRVRLNLQIQVKKASCESLHTHLAKPLNRQQSRHIMPSKLISFPHTFYFHSCRPRLAPQQPLHLRLQAIIRPGRAPLHKTRGILRRHCRSMGRSRMRTIMLNWGLIIRWIWKVSWRGEALRGSMSI